MLECTLTDIDNLSCVPIMIGDTNSIMAGYVPKELFLCSVDGGSVHTSIIKGTKCKV